MANAHCSALSAVGLVSLLFVLLFLFADTRLVIAGRADFAMLLLEHSVADAVLWKLFSEQSFFVFAFAQSSLLTTLVTLWALVVAFVVYN